jgi:hypothetical protein
MSSDLLIEERLGRSRWRGEGDEPASLVDRRYREAIVRHGKSQISEARSI